MAVQKTFLNRNEEAIIERNRRWEVENELKYVKNKLEKAENKVKNLTIQRVTNSLNTKHLKCLGDGVDDCGYNTKIACDDCKYNNSPFGKKDPNAKCNQA
jgi:hypothetical protein